MLKAKELSGSDLKKIKAKHGVDIYAFSVDAMMGSGKLAPTMEMVEAICNYCAPEDNLMDQGFTKALNYAMQCLGLTFGGESEKKSESIGNG